ncbi:MAG: anti-sigma factor domain-containing protein [Thermoanaerobacteraceae bacterium]|nr:anti-sigma factor domain-containing protein [Thermoanaerobacteraceae bacterium]
MKAIIVDFDGDYLIVANSRGDFKRIYNNYSGCQIGDEITIKDNRALLFGKMLSSKKVLALAACVLFMIMTSYGIYGYINPITYVTVDINPSVEFSLNRYDLVRDVRGLNEEGKNIIGDGRKYKNLRLDQALNLLLSSAVKADYLNKDTNTVMLTVSNVKDSISSDKKNQLQEIAKTQLAKIIEEEEKNTSSSKQQKSEEFTTESLDAQDTDKRDFKIIVKNTTYEKHQEAKKIGISQGKLVLYEKLKKVKPNAVLNHVKEASVGEILNEIEAVKPELKDKSKARPNANSDNKKQQKNEDKKQQLKDIKQLEKHMEEQLKNIQKENKNQLKGKIKDTKEHLKKAIKDTKKDLSKEIKKELKDKIGNTDKFRQNKNNRFEKNNKKKTHDPDNNFKSNKNNGKNNKNKK